MTGRITRGPLAVAVGTVALVASIAIAPAGAHEGHQHGEFGHPFVENPEQSEVCIEDQDDDGRMECKPTAGSMSILTDGEVIYWNALEATEDVEASIALEYGNVSINDQSRFMTIGDTTDPQATTTWELPDPLRADTADEAYDSDPLFPEPLNNAATTDHNDRALFCADLVQLSDGRLLTVGGTSYYQDPSVPGTDYGVVELEGTRDTRIFDPETKTWEASGEMGYGRWYPSAVTLGDGDVFIASGVTRLMKPMYADQAPTESGRNVAQTETFDLDTQTWEYNGEDADKSLPLYPRLHLLPNGLVFYDTAGQVFNPNGYAYDEALWNMASAYDPETKTWTDLGVPGIGTQAPGFRGSTFSIMLPLREGEDGRFDKAEFLTAGGILGVTPGTYFATDHSRISTVDIAEDGTLTYSDRETGVLNNARWYSTGVLLPDGSVMAFQGGDRDEVVGPGTAFPVLQAERFDPETEQWETMASTTIPRTYHSTAALLPDGRVLIGGHAPISTLYGNNTTLPGGFTPQETRNPTFEIYSPPYALSDDRPEILSAPATVTPDGGTMTVTMQPDVDLDDVSKVMLVRRTAITHLVDGDQRALDLEFGIRNMGEGQSLAVNLPDQAAALPPGQYMLFVSTMDADGQPIPSEGAPNRVPPPVSTTAG